MTKVHAFGPHGSLLCSGEWHNSANQVSSSTGKVEIREVKPKQTTVKSRVTCKNCLRRIAAGAEMYERGRKLSKYQIEAIQNLERAMAVNMAREAEFQRRLPPQRTPTQGFTLILPPKTRLDG